jgi:PPE-repeat protein
MTTAKTQAALAWLQFISSPKWNSLIVNAEGNDLPIIQGATTSPQLQPILNQLNSESKYYYPMALFDSLTSSSFQTIDGLYLEYVDGYISLGTALSEYDTDAASIISAYNAQHPQLVAETVTYENKVLGIK